MRCRQEKGGLKGNLIGVDRLTQILTNYLREQSFSEPREKAGRLIQQLRERNFILCYRGADIYGFVHRTFLEYFCAIEIVHRFEKQRTLTFEQLQDEFFGSHWQDETWHEILQLICGMIDIKFGIEIINYLVVQQDKYYRNLVLVAKFISETDIKLNISILSEKLLISLQKAIKEFLPRYETYTDTDYETALTILRAIATYWKDAPTTLTWLQSCTQSDWDDNINAQQAAIEIISEVWKGNSDVLDWLKCCVQSHDQGYLRRWALRFIGRDFKDYPDTLTWLKTRLCLKKHPETFEDQQVRSGALEAIASFFKEDSGTRPMLFQALSDEGHLVRGKALGYISEYCKDELEVFLLLKSYLQKDTSGFVRAVIVSAIAEDFSNHPDMKSLLQYYAQSDKDQRVRQSILEAFSEKWIYEPGVFDFLANCVLHDFFEREDEWQENPRQTALAALLKGYPTHPQTIELLHDRAINNPDEQLREWAQQELEKLEQS